MPIEEATQAEPELRHADAINVLAETRSVQMEKLQALQDEHRDLLEAADRARNEINRQAAYVERLGEAMNTLQQGDTLKASVNDHRRDAGLPEYGGR